MNHTTWPGFISGHAVLAAGPEIFQRELSDIYIYSMAVVGSLFHGVYILKQILKTKRFCRNHSSV